MLAKIGPGANTIWRRPVAASSCTRSVPVMSDGIRSGANWMGANFSSSTRAIARVHRGRAAPHRTAFGDAGDHQGLGEPRRADDQAVAAHKQRVQHLVDDLFLPDDH